MLLLRVLDRVHLVDARPVVGGVSPEGDVQVLQEQVHACRHTHQVKNLSQSLLVAKDILAHACWQSPVHVLRMLECMHSETRLADCAMHSLSL